MFSLECLCLVVVITTNRCKKTETETLQRDAKKTHEGIQNNDKTTEVNDVQLPHRDAEEERDANRPRTSSKTAGKTQIVLKRAEADGRDTKQQHLSEKDGGHCVPVPTGPLSPNLPMCLVEDFSSVCSLHSPLL